MKENKEVTVDCSIISFDVIFRNGPKRTSKGEDPSFLCKTPSTTRDAMISLFSGHHSPQNSMEAKYKCYASGRH